MLLPKWNYINGSPKSTQTKTGKLIRKNILFSEPTLTELVQMNALRPFPSTSPKKVKRKINSMRMKPAKQKLNQTVLETANGEEKYLETLIK